MKSAEVKQTWDDIRFSNNNWFWLMPVPTKLSVLPSTSVRVLFFLSQFDLWISLNVLAAGQTSAPMPVRDEIGSLSGDDDECCAEGTPEELLIAQPRKKRKVRVAGPTKEARASENFLRSLLGHECSCKRKRCLQQFAAPELFSKLQSYRKNWYGMHKLDQDAAAPCLKSMMDVWTWTFSTLISHFLVHHCWMAWVRHLPTSKALWKMQRDEELILRDGQLWASRLAEGLGKLYTEWDPLQKHTGCSAMCDIQWYPCKIDAIIEAPV